jgi:starch phosphorylase
MIRDGYFGKEPPDLFKPIIDSLLDNGDYFMHLKDFRSYIECQQGISKAFLDQDRWTEMSILNVAGMGYFSSDRAVKEYADQIWGAKPIESLLPPERRS